MAPWSWPTAGALAVVLVVAAVQFFPGFPLAAKNRDPGVYVNHAVAIARQGSVVLDRPRGRDRRRGRRGRRRGPHRHRRGRRGLAQAALPGLPDRPRRPRAPPPGLLPPLAGHPGHGPRPRRADRAVQPDPAVRPRRRRPAVPRRPPGLRPGGGDGRRRPAGRQRAAGVAGQVPDGRVDVAAPLRWAPCWPSSSPSAPDGGWRPPSAGALVGVGFLARPDGHRRGRPRRVGAGALVGAATALDGRAVAFAVGLAPPLLFGDLPGLRAGARATPAPRTASRRSPQAVAGPSSSCSPRWRCASPWPGGPSVARVGPDAWTGTGSCGSSATASSACSPSSWPWPGSGDRLLGPNYRINKVGDRTRGYDELEPEAPGPLPHAGRASRPRSGALWRRRPRALGGRPLGPRAARPARWPRSSSGSRASPPTSCGGAAATCPMVVPTLLVLVGVGRGLALGARGRRPRPCSGSVRRSWCSAMGRVHAAPVLGPLGPRGVRRLARGHRGARRRGRRRGRGLRLAGRQHHGAELRHHAVHLAGPAGAGPPDGRRRASLLALQEALGDRPLYLVATATSPRPAPPGCSRRNVASSPSSASSSTASPSGPAGAAPSPWTSRSGASSAGSSDGPVLSGP